MPLLHNHLMDSCSYVCKNALLVLAAKGGILGCLTSTSIGSLNSTVGGGGGEDKVHMHMVYLTFPRYSAQWYTRSMRKCQTRNSSSADVCWKCKAAFSHGEEQ